MDIKQKSLDALVIMNTAIKNVRLYPPTSAAIINTIERLHLAFLDMFALEAPIIFAESEKNLLICGKPLDQKDQERFQVTALLNILLNFGIKSITFDTGLEKAELSAFLELLSKKPESVKNEGGLLKIMDEKNVQHIYLDEKVYVSMNKDQKIISSLDITDDQITQFFMQTHPELAGDPEKLQEMMKDPEWLSQTFQAGLSQMMGQKKVLSNVELSENLEKMIALMDKVAGSLEKKDRDKVSQHIGESIVSIDNDVTKQLTAQNIEHLFGGMLLQYLVSELSEAKYVAVRMSNAGISDDKQGDGRGGDFAEGEGSGGAARPEKDDYQSKINDLKQMLNSQLKSDEKGFLNTSLMSVLPNIIEQLIVQKEHETIETIISRLLKNLLSENVEVRSQASKGLADIFETLPLQRKSELIERISAALMNWIKLETLTSPSYEKICDSLQQFVQDLIRRGRFGETIPILDVFSDIHAGILEKNVTIREISSEVIKKLATEEHLALLFKEYHTNKQNKQVEAGKILVRFGDFILERLLDNVQKVADSDERVRIMRLIIEMRQKAVPFVLQQISKDASWYYLRNLAYILGHIGNEESASALKPLLLHENERLRLEALKSIYRTGGKDRGQLLLSVLPQVDDQFKRNIIETLGNAKCVDAVPDLLNMLKTRSAIAPSLRADLEEKICIALGAIGSPEAMPALSEIAESKYFLRIGTYPKKVKIAAGMALVSIRKKQPEMAGQ
jgi:HEAT repeat protein